MLLYLGLLENMYDFFRMGDIIQPIILRNMYKIGHENGLESFLCW